MKHTQILLAALAMLTAAGCGSNKKTDDAEAEMARGSYSGEKNKVTVVRLERRTFNKQLVCNGKLDAQGKATLQFAQQGTIERINYREGQTVAAGALVAVLDKSQAQQQLKQSQLAYDKALLQLSDRLLDYNLTIADTGSMPENQRRAVFINTGFSDAKLNLDDARRKLADCELRAPFAGKVIDLKGREHEPASGAFCTIIDDSRYQVRFSVLETEYPFIRVGQKVMITPFANAELNIEGNILAINPTVDKNGQISVTATVKGEQGLIDGMNVKVVVEDTIADQLTVPKSAVVIRDGQEVLFKSSNGRSVWTYVKVVMSNSVEHIVEPNTERGAELNIGDSIIISGNLNLGDNVEIEVDKD